MKKIILQIQENNKIVQKYIKIVQMPIFKAVLLHFMGLFRTFAKTKRRKSFLFTNFKKHGMMITRMKNLLIAVVCLLTSVSAQAQFTGSADQYPTKGYEGSPIEFNLSEVATTLGTDATTLGTAITEYITAEAPATILFAANGTDWTAALEAANHGFWMAADGTPVGYGETSVWYCSPEVDDAFTTLTFNVGQMPEVMKEGEKGQVTITLKFNDKEATFALTLNVIAKPEYNVPEATVIEKDLTIVGEKELTLEQFPRGSYDSDALSIEIADLVEKLGIDQPGVLGDDLGKVLYTTWYNNGDVEQGGGMKKDSLTNSPTGEGIGYWFRAVQDAEGQESGEVSATNWGDVDKFYINNFAFDTTTNTLSGVLGQYPGSCKANEEWYAYIYFIWGNKAYRVKITLKLLEQEQGSGMANYNKVGEETVVVEQGPTDDYSTSAVKPDVEAIAAALGCEVSSLGIAALDDKDNFGNSTANNGGYWFTSAGTVTSWGATAAFFVEPAENGNYATLNIGQYPNALAIGDQVSANIYFVNGTNYYQYTIALKIVEPQYNEQNFESVATRAFSIQAVPANDYPIDATWNISTADIEALIGTDSPTLYGLNVDSVYTATGEKYSKKWSCDPKPGFWLAKDGTVSTWGGESPVGICFGSDGTFQFFQYPNANGVGDVFTTTLFLVNEETGKMITFNITVNFVETVVEKQIVGSENLNLPLTTEGKKIVIDAAKATEALGITVDDLLDKNNYYLRGLTASGVYGEGNNAENGLSFADDGGFDLYGNTYFSIEKDGENVVINIATNNEVADDFSVNGQFCIEVGEKQYVYYVKFLSEKLYEETGIRTISSDSRINGQIFDLSGRKVMNPAPGIYIQNGKKIVVK